MSDNDPTMMAAQAAAVVDVSSFSNYLRRVVPVLLEDVDDTPEALNNALKDKSSVECMKKFLSDSQIAALFIQKASLKGKKNYENFLICIVLTIFDWFSDDGESVGAEGEEKESFVYSITIEVKYSHPKANRYQFFF